MENQKEIETQMDFDTPSQDIDPEAATQAFGDSFATQIDVDAPTQAFGDDENQTQIDTDAPTQAGLSIICDILVEIC